VTKSDDRSASWYSHAGGDNLPAIEFAISGFGCNFYEKMFIWRLEGLYFVFFQY
jgi:hypothetical protein